MLVAEHLITSIQAPTVGLTLQICEICSETLSSELMQNHMGGHILRKFRGVQQAGEHLEMVCQLQLNFIYSKHDFRFPPSILAAFVVNRA
jgi:hypothetical protein